MRKIAIAAAITAACMSAVVSAAADTPAKKGYGPFNIGTNDTCIDGHNPFAKGTTARILSLSEGTLKRYLSLAGGSAAANVRSSFTTDKTEPVWDAISYTKQPVVLTWSRDSRAGNVSAIDDPVARAIANTGADVATLLKSEQFLVAGAKLSAMGMWRVLAPGDPNKVLGWYRARFKRQDRNDGQTWQLITLEVITGAARPADIVQYCVLPGDVELHRAELEKKRADKDAKRERREKEREARRAAAKP
jgi:opacity protein-like surface antigen